MHLLINGGVTAQVGVLMYYVPSISLSMVAGALGVHRVLNAVTREPKPAPVPIRLRHTGEPLASVQLRKHIPTPLAPSMAPVVLRTEETSILPLLLVIVMPALLLRYPVLDHGLGLVLVCMGEVQPVVLLKKQSIVSVVGEHVVMVLELILLPLMPPMVEHLVLIPTVPLKLVEQELIVQLHIIIVLPEQV